MTIPIPLSVSLTTPRSTRSITTQLRSLRFREVAVGGFASCEVSFDRPLTVLPEEIGYFATLKVHYGSVVVWEGRVEDFGRTAGSDGVVWELAALGPSAHAHDRTIPLIYVDTLLTDMVRADNVTKGATNSVGQDPGTSTVQEALILQLPDGLHVITDSRVAVRYDKLWRAGQKLARYDYTWDAGRTSTSLHVEAVARTDGTGGATSRTQTFSTSGGATSPKVIVTDFASGRNTIEFRIRWSGSSTSVADDDTWASIRNLVIQGTRYSAAGSELLTAASYTSNTLLASQIVADLLGRLLTAFDGANAVIETTSYTIDQLAYPDGADPAKVLDDLMTLEPGYRWGAYESNSAGKHRFEWKAWPTSVRYEADVKDGIYSPASAGDLWNAVQVRWRDAQGATRSTRVTSTVPVLDDAGLTRETQIDLGDEVGSAAAAAQVGAQWLAEHDTPPNAGTLRIARPVLDLVSGRMVQPYQIKAGELIRVRGILPSVDSLNASTRDGATVFRVWAKDYDAASATASLELDSPVRTQQQLVAAATRPERRRR